MDIKALFTSAIERTQHPLAPFILQDAHDGAVKLGAMLASISDRDLVTDHTTKLMQYLPENDKEVEKIISNPAYVTALCAMLAAAIVGFAKVTNHPTNENTGN